MLSDQDITTLLLTLRLAFTVTVILLVIGTPLAWWLSRTRHWIKAPLLVVIAMPLVLPPTVLGFYVLLALGPEGTIGALSNALGFGSLAFTFWGLVIGSVIYSMPFVVQPIYNAFSALGPHPMEAAATLGARPVDAFFTVALPLAKPGVLTAAILGFMHTVGEFGVVLMIGGNIPGETQLVSLRIYEYVESLEYGKAHTLAAFLVASSFISLLLVYLIQSKASHKPVMRNESL